MTDVLMRYAHNGNTVHLVREGAPAGGMINRAFCCAETGHRVGVARGVLGTRALKFCKRCTSPQQLAVIDGLIAFVMWARMLALPPCDKCGQPNLLAAESNYCPGCRAEYQARIRRDPEQTPVGGR